MRAIVIALVMTLASPAAKAWDIPEDFEVGMDTLVVSKEELICLALNDYWEARGEALAGRLAVAKVVLNRAMDPRYPANLCDVIKENRSRTGHLCQFSWYCDGKPDSPYEARAWLSSLRLASAVLQKDSGIVDPTDGSLWYHATFVDPPWAGRLNETMEIGGHVFYAETDGEAERLVDPDAPLPDLHAFARWHAARDGGRAVARAEDDAEENSDSGG